MDPKELDFADTIYSRDIDNRVFQTIAMQCIANIEGIVLSQGGLFDHLLGRDQSDSRLKSISIGQNQKDHSVSVKIEVHVQFGISIPEKAEEIQSKVAREITKLTGIHVSGVHVIFKNIYFEKPAQPEILSKEPEEELIEIQDPN